MWDMTPWYLGHGALICGTYGALIFETAHIRVWILRGGLMPTCDMDESSHTQSESDSWMSHVAHNTNAHVCYGWVMSYIILRWARRWVMAHIILMPMCGMTHPWVHLRMWHVPHTYKSHVIPRTTCVTHYYGVAATSRLFRIIRLFCKRDLEKGQYSAKESCNFKATHRSHPIVVGTFWLFSDESCCHTRTHTHPSPHVAGDVCVCHALMISKESRHTHEHKRDHHWQFRAYYCKS